MGALLKIGAASVVLGILSTVDPSLGGLSEAAGTILILYVIAAAFGII